MTRQTPKNYVPLDSNYYRDVAIRKAGPTAELLYIRALAFAKNSRTAGFVSAWDIVELASGIRGAKSCAKLLVSVGLWEEVEDGWRIRSWDRWNGVEEAVSAGGHLGNHLRWHVQRGITDPDCTICAESPDESGGDRGAMPPRDLSPILTELNTSSKEEVGGDDRGEAAPGPERQPSAQTPVREDVEALCEHLQRRMVANDCKRPTINKSWRDEARRLLDLDRRPLAEAHDLIDWCQNDSFWRANINSMPKFRKQYDQLRLKSQDGRGTGGVNIPVVNGERAWSKADLEKVLGVDHWRPPRPPSGLDPDGQWQWLNDVTAQHRAERIREAEAKLSGRST